MAMCAIVFMVNQVSRLRMRSHHLFVLVAMTLFCRLGSSAMGEIIFQDSFTHGSGEVTNSSPFLDVQGNGWQTPSGASALSSDGQGHFFATTANGGAASIALVPIGLHGSMTLTATMQLPTAFASWIGIGFANTNQTLGDSGSQSGPWLEVNGDGSVVFFGGAGQWNTNTFPGAWTNNRTPITFSLKYDAFNKTVTVAAINNGTTNYLLNAAPITTSLSSVTAHYLAVEFSATDVVLSHSNPSLSSIAVDWYPRPFPMLTLPVPANSKMAHPVGIPTGGDDTTLIQNALNFAAKHNPCEVIFDPVATYIITNGEKVSSIALTLTHATNVLINGGGCKILVRNPRIGFLHMQSCSNVIVKGITVDYDPLPFTQGVVTRNLYTDPTENGAEAAIEFRPDVGYPSPTNADYLDGGAERWGTIINTNYPGRGADNRYTIYYYSGVTATTIPGVFRVKMADAGSVDTIQAGDFWNMVSRWNGSADYSASDCYQITYLDLTNYAGVAVDFQCASTPLVNQIDCAAKIGPTPSGATRPRMRNSDAGGGYYENTRIGPWVEGCDLTALGDDVANAYTSPFVITNAPRFATNTFSIWTYNIQDNGGPPGVVTEYEMRVGDQLDFFNALTGVIYDQATITNVQLPFVSVDHPVAGIVNGTYQTNTLVYNNSLNTSCVYLNNQFSNSRIHGIYCRANNMLIAHNSVSGMGLSAISGFPDLLLESPNSFVPTNVVIMDNVMSDCSYSYQSINNNIPDEEPAFALVELHLTRFNSDYVSNTFGIYGIRILNNAFLNWRRAPISLHNVGDVRIEGNYFGPPLTKDGLVPLADDVIADLWSCDYSTMHWANNVNATGIADDESISEDGSMVVLTNAYQGLTPPQLDIQIQQTNAIVSWSSVTPAFVLQQNNSLDGSWMGLTNNALINGSSNVVTQPLNAAANQSFFRAIQR